MPSGWTVDEVRAWYTDAADHLVVPSPGQVVPNTSFPPQVEGWLETLRFVHRELWPEAEGLGTTVVLEAGGSLWVLTRGAHRATAVCEAGNLEPVPAQTQDRREIWRLAPGGRWRVEVGFEDGPAPLWTARWRPTHPPEGSPRRVNSPSSGPTPPAGEATAGLAPVLPLPVRTVTARFAGMAKHPVLGPVVRHRLWLSRVAALALLAAAAWIWTPRSLVASAAGWMGDFMLGRYRAHVTSVPDGALLLLDGHSTGLHTPVWLVVKEGEHRVEATLGEFGSVTLGLRGGRGQRIEREATLVGRLAIGCSDTSVVLYARVDGRPVGRVPAIVDSVPAGVRQLSFQGRDVRPWTEEVELAVGKTTQVLARPERVPESGLILARAYRVGTQGLTDLAGAVVLLDGQPKGVTPLKLDVPRGLHTVRLVSGEEHSPVQLLRVEGGGELYATAEFGRSPEPEVVARTLGAASIVKPPVVRARLVSQMPIRVAEMRLNVRRGGRDFNRAPMALQSDGTGVTGDALLDLSGLKPGMDVFYFVTIESDQGEDFVSEMRRLRVLP